MRRVSLHVRRNAVAWLALFFALTGTGIAASRYVITSTSQIKPSVLHELGAGTPKALSAATPKGPKAIIARILSAGGPVALTNTPEQTTSIPVSGNTWTQPAGQAEIVFGQVNATYPSDAECGGELEGSVGGVIDGELGSGAARIFPHTGTATYKLSWYPRLAEHDQGGAEWLIDPTVATTHTIEVLGSGQCKGGGHIIVNSVAIDVVGLR